MKIVCLNIKQIIRTSVRTRNICFPLNNLCSV